MCGGKRKSRHFSMTEKEGELGMLTEMHIAVIGGDEDT